MDKEASPKIGRYDKEDSFSNIKVQAILDMYLIKGLQKSIKFSEFENVLIPKTFKHKKGLERYLTYLTRDRILIHENKRDPYYLKEKYYNIVAQKYNVKIMESFPSTKIIPYISSDFYCTFYGFDLYQLDNHERKKLVESLDNLYKTLDNLNEIKERQIERCYKDIFDKVSKKLNNKEKKFLSNEYRYFICFSLIHILRFIHPSKEGIKKLYSKYLSQFYNEEEINLATNTTYLLIENLSKLYPFNYGISAFEPTSISPLSFWAFKPKKEDKIRLYIAKAISKDQNIDFDEFISRKLKNLGKKKERYEKNKVLIPDDLRKEIDFYKKMRS